MERIVLVTGAASGIGAATCRALAAPGVGLLIHTRQNRAGAEQVAEEARTAGAEVELAFGDLADPAVPAALVAACVARFGGLGVLVSNAGFPDRTAIGALSDAAFARSVDAMPFAFLRLARAAIPALRAARQARVIAVGSFVAHAFRPGLPCFPASAAAKAGLEALVRALALELAPTRDGECGGAGLHPQGCRCGRGPAGTGGRRHPPHPARPPRRAGGGGGGDRVPGLAGGVLHHRTGAAGGWRAGDVGCARGPSR